ncbi:hypothetical protein U1Q18_033786 [Sarracenia purpurea var. burkii]
MGRRRSSPVNKLFAWVRRQSMKVKIFLAFTSLLSSLVALKLLVKDHNHFYIASEAIHVAGILVLIYKLTTQKNCYAATSSSSSQSPLWPFSSVTKLPQQAVQPTQLAAQFPQSTTNPSPQPAHPSQQPAHPSQQPAHPSQQSASFRPAPLLVYSRRSAAPQPSLRRPSPNVHPMITRSKAQQASHSALLSTCTSAPPDIEPTTYKQASKYAHWVQAMDEEYCALIHQGLSLKSQELTAMFLAARVYCSFAFEGDIHTVLDSATLVSTIWVMYMIRFKLKSTYTAELDNLAVYYMCFCLRSKFSWEEMMPYQSCYGLFVISAENSYEAGTNSEDLR